MKADHAREIDRLEFEAEATALRQRAYGLVCKTMKAPVTIASRAPTTATLCLRINPPIVPRAALAPASPPTVKGTPGRRAKLHAFDGRQLTLAEISTMTGVPTMLLWSRINRAGMAVEDAVAAGRIAMRGFNSMGARAQQRLARP